MFWDNIILGNGNLIWNTCLVSLILEMGTLDLDPSSNLTHTCLDAEKSNVMQNLFFSLSKDDGTDILLKHH
jgi:hypothetical protein